MIYLTPKNTGNFDGISFCCAALNVKGDYNYCDVIMVKDTVITGTNNERLHEFSQTVPITLDDGFYRVFKKNKNEIILKLPVDGSIKYPDTSYVWPKRTPHKIIHINLIDATLRSVAYTHIIHAMMKLEGFNQRMITIQWRYLVDLFPEDYIVSLYSTSLPLVFESGSFRALIAPMEMR